MKFMEDFLAQAMNREATSHLKMYINCFSYHVTRSFYQTMLKFLSQENTKGLINGMLLLKIMNFKQEKKKKEFASFEKTVLQSNL